MSGEIKQRIYHEYWDNGHGQAEHAPYCKCQPRSIIVNPTAVGNPDESPVVFVGGDLRALLNPCACGGVNGFHAESCQEETR